MGQSIIIALTIFLLHHCQSIKEHAGGVIVSPPRTTSVCNGDQLELTCATTGDFLEWSFFLVPDSEGGTTPRRYKRSLGRNTPTSTLEVNSITFTFSIISESTESNLSLVSRLVTTPVIDSLNGTQVNCTNVETSNSTSTVITIIDESNYDEYQTGAYNILSEQFERDSVIVTLGVRRSTFHSYYVSVSPQLSSVVSTGSAMFQFEIHISYNTTYNVSVTAVPDCGKNNVTTYFKLHYTKCGNPADRIDDPLIKVKGYQDPSIEGSNVTLGCSVTPRLVLDLVTSTCMGNGEWEPNPSDFNCSDTIMIASMITTSQELDSYNFQLVTVLGSVLGVICLILLFLSAIIIVLFVIKTNKVKGSNGIRAFHHDYHSERYITRESSHNGDAKVELSPTYGGDNDHNVTTSGLIYADIGQSSFKQQLTNTLDLDDTGVQYAQLNHSLMNQKAKCHDNAELENNPHIGDSPCVNLDNVLIQLRPQVSAKWYQFGSAIGVDREVLNHCAKTCSPEDCIVEILDYWLRNSTEKPTWRIISKALKAINLLQLADDIERVYITGKLPIETDNMNWISPPQESESAMEFPPPIPPKSLGATMKILQCSDHEKNQPKSGMATKSDNSLPALPPKPINKLVFN